jgi:hypothetical protein
MHHVAATALFLGLALPGVAAEAPGEPPARVAAIAPFLEEGTLLLLHLDVSRLNREELTKQLAAALALDNRQQAQLDQAVRHFREAKGKDLFAVWALDDLFQNPFLVVPLEAGADEKALAALLREGTGEDFLGARPVTTTQALILGSKSQVQRLKRIKPVARPEVAAALAAVGNASMQMVLVPPAPLLRALEELVPALPKELGGGPGTLVTRGLRWAAAGLDLSPRADLRLVIQSQNAAAATAFRAYLGKLSQGKHPDGTPLLLGRHGLDQLVAGFTPDVVGDRLVLHRQGEKVVPVVSAVSRLADLGTGKHVMRNLHQIAVAFHAYSDAYGRLPRAVFRDPRGKPLLSWRVYVLPFLGADNLYKEFHLDEAWDGEHNKKLIARMPPVFRGPSRRLNEEGKTVFLVPRGPGTAFPEDGAEVKIPQGFPDGTSNTIVLVAADDDHAVIWTKPDDLPFDPKAPRTGLSGRRYGGVRVATGDASALVFPETMNDQAFAGWFMRNSGKRRVTP